MFAPESIKNYREEKGISQEQLMIDLAQAGLRVSRPTISAWETGESIPNANDIAVMAEAFHKPLKYFFAN